MGASRTAIAAARHRAAHQIAKEGRIFRDPLAIGILGEDAGSLARWIEEAPETRRMRIFIAVRARLAEDGFAAAVARGVRQVVVLGAGLDTYAYRCPFENVRIFEVDQPDTQAWKRQRLAEARIDAPVFLTFAPVDFERENLSDGLAAAGFDTGLETYFTWLGVTPYLSEDAIWATLRTIAALPNGAHVIFDYSNPPEEFTRELRADHEGRAARVAAIGEPFLSYFTTKRLHAGLRDLGLVEIEDWGRREILARYFPGRALPESNSGGHVILASNVRRQAG